MSLGLIPKIFYPVDMVCLFSKLMGMVYPMMVKFTDIQCIIGWIGIRINNAIRINLFLDNRQKSFCPGIGNYGCIDSAISF